jgi:phytoene dehydrogenase-like protein
MRDYDLLVVGAGHNALVTAAYVAAAGYRVGVFERRGQVGGAVSTAEAIPGYRIDLGGSAHILIRLTGIVEELGLDRFGLEYIDLDPLFFMPLDDGPPLFIYRDVERTIDSLEAAFPGEGVGYRRFIDDWLPFAQQMRDAFQAVPSPLDLGRRALIGPRPRLPWRAALHHILKPYGEVVDGYFQTEALKTLLVWMAAQSGPPPTEPLTGPFLLWHPLYHEGGFARPRGGSGMLTQALQRHIEAHGGLVHVSSPVDEILVEGGRAVGIRVGKDVATARAVVSGTHVLETFHRLLPDAHRPPEARNVRVGNGFGAMLRVALDAPVRYSASTGPESRTGLQMLCRDRRQISTAYGQFLAGRPASDPPLLAMTFSAVDDSLAPPGCEVLWLWGQYFPYELAGGSWDEEGERVADVFLDTFERFAPGTRAHVVGTLFQHPLWLERELGLLRGNVMHVEMSLDQMFFLRPFAGMSGYRTHIKALYLTGASTHPGGGIMGASGRNTARIVLRDLDRRRL